MELNKLKACDHEAMKSIYTNSYATREVDNLKHTMRHMQRDYMCLELEMAQSNMEIKENFETEMIKKENILKDASLKLEELISSFSVKAKLYEELAKQDSQRIAALEKEVSEMKGKSYLPGEFTNNIPFSRDRVFSG